MYWGKSRLPRRMTRRRRIAPETGDAPAKKRPRGHAATHALFRLYFIKRSRAAPAPMKKGTAQAG